MADIFITLSIVFSSIIIAIVFCYWKTNKLKRDVRKNEEKMRKNIYELAILKELGVRTGYSLNVQNIIDVITGSLKQLIDYSVTSYMFIEPEKIIFKVYLEKSVSREFINDIKDRMINSLSALLNKDFSKIHIEEILSGALLVEDIKEPVRSFFNIPLVIGGKVASILTIADTKAGLYKEEEMTILYKITRQASNAVTSLQEVVNTEQRKLNAMVESINEGVVMTDKDYKIMVVNPAAKNAVGISSKEDISIFDFIEKLGEKFDIRGKLEESVKLDKSLSVDNVLINNRFFQIIVSPVRSTFGTTKNEILGAVIIFHDITPMKEIERIREDFTSMMVHELRSPLSNIKNIAELLLKKKTSKSYSKYLEFMFQNSSRMLELVNDLLDVAKLETEKFEIYKQPSNIVKIIKERADFFKTSAKFSNVKIETCLDKNIPENIDFDPIYISQVLNNLISNAIKFAPKKGTITVQALLHKKEQDISKEAKSAGIKWFLNKNSQNIANLPDSLIVAVTDYGMGLSQDKIAQLFIKFKQFGLAIKEREKKGTGLGLVVVKGIIQAHKGFVGVASEENIGSSFYFILPM
ncbi:MAG: ATP-binding protein [Patescibacteria group bacterium]